MNETRQYRRKVDDLLAKLSLAREQALTEKIELVKAKRIVGATIKAQKIVQQVAQVVQQRAHKRIASVVSRCLEAVFDDPYQFNITFEKKRGKTEATLTFSRRKLVLDALTAAGGGVIDVAAFALRLACLVLTRPKLRQLIVLDEPFRFVSSEYRPRVKALLEVLSEEMNVQFIVVTHHEDLQAGKIVRIK